MKKILSFFLVLVMTASLVLTFVSCNEEEEKKDDVSVENQEGNAFMGDEDIFAERAKVDDELPEKDYGGRDFRVVGHSRGEFYIDPENINQGNLIVDAKAKRNVLVEERFNINIVPTFSGTYMEVNDWVSKSILSGVDEFDLLVNQVVDSGAMVLKNLFLNWYDIPHVDFTKPWWANSTSTDLTYDGKCVLAISDFNNSAITCTYIMVFNKNLANAYDLGNIYDVVFDGNWTYDYFYELVKDIYIDLDGSTDRTEGDFYGMAQGHYSLGPYLYSFDNPIVKKDEDGVPTLSLKTDKINQIVSKLYDSCFNTQGIYYNKDVWSGQGMFLEKRAVFTIASIGSLVHDSFRNFDDEYGVLPLPKWDESQQNYLTGVGGEHTATAVPKTVKDTEFVGIITEALAAESYKHVTPTYYEIALKTRYLRDNESKKVLDIIIDGTTYDFGYVFNGWQSPLSGTLEHLFQDANSNFESYYNKHYQTSRLHFRAIIKCFDRL